MSKTHILILLACCLIPLIALGAIFLLRIPASTVVIAGLALLCPISHLLMMKWMVHEPKAGHQEVQTKVSGAAQSRHES